MRLIAAILGLTVAGVAFAQSEQFIDQEKWHRQACFSQRQVVMRLIHLKEAGMPVEEFMVRNPIPGDWSDEMKIEAAHMVAIIWTTGSDEVRVWAQGVFERCDALTQAPFHGSIDK